MITLLGAPLPAHSADPFINLSWYLQDTVVATTLSHDEYLNWRSADIIEIESDLRQIANPETIWIERLPTDNDISDVICDDFAIRTFANWQSRDFMTIPQWREAWHGVAAFADHSVNFFSPLKVKRVTLSAAVRSPGIPSGAFVEDGSGALKAKFFDTASHFIGAGFKGTRKLIAPLSMRLLNHQSCKGFELYTWSFRR